MKTNFYNCGQSLTGIIIVLVMVGLVSGGLYYYFSKQIPEAPEIPEKPEEPVTPTPTPTPSPRITPTPTPTPKPLPKASLKEPVVEITARPAEISSKNSPIRTVFGITFVLAQEFETGKELQVEIKEAPPKEIDSFQTWTVGYVIKNTTDSSFVLAYDIEPSEYKTSGAVVVDPDGDGPEKWFYYTFGKEVLLSPKNEQYFNISFSPPNGLTEITPKMVFKGFNTQEPFFTHEFTVKVTYVPPPAECETSICPEGKIIYWRGGVDNYKCPMLECVSPGIKCAVISPGGGCAVAPQSCESLGPQSEGWQLADKCPSGPEQPKDCAIISPKGVCAESTSMQCTWNLPPEGWTMVDKCPD